MSKPIVLVIGGSSGIGQATCHLLKDEYEVVNMSRRKNDEVDNIFCDVESYQSVKNAFIELKNRFGIPYGLVYCSGFVIPQGILELTEDVLLQTYQINILGVFRCVQEFVKLNKSEGKIILISSTSALRPSPGWTAYSSSKSAIVNLSISLSEELKSYGIKVYCLSPGRCATPLRKILAVNEDQSKIMQPDSVGKVIRQAILDEGLLDGQNLVVRKVVD